MSLLPIAGRVRLGITLSALAVLALTAGGAVAQSFLQQLFGIGNAPAVRPAPQRLGAPAPRIELRSIANTVGSGDHGNRHWRDGDEDQDGHYDSGGGRKYRTMCVRLCDGYYFPVSNATTHRTFQRDANMCEAGCGAEARLFYMPAGETDIDTMSDLTGLAYSALPNAYKYRKTLVSGCTCKPMPWSEAARARHRGYAIAAAAQSRPEEKIAVRAEERQPANRFPLPPAVKGPGVVVISASGVATTAETPSMPADDAEQKAGAELEPGDDNSVKSSGALAAVADLPVTPAIPRAAHKAQRQRVTIINASEPLPAQGGKPGKRARAVHAAPGKGSGFGGFFSSEPRRIVYPGQ